VRNTLCTVCVRVALAASQYQRDYDAVAPNGAFGMFPDDWMERQRWLLTLAMSEDPRECHYLRRRGSGLSYPIFAVTVAAGEARCAVHAEDR
jgi:hypothetical protein